MRAVLDGVFTVPGDGFIDFPAILRVLADAGYAGWLVVEAEQDPAKAHPLTYAKMGYANLARMARRRRALRSSREQTMMARLKVGIIGGGLITQVEHLPNLLDLPQLFQVAGVADPFAKVRAHIEQRWGVPTFETTEALLLDAPRWRGDRARPTATTPISP